MSDISDIIWEISDILWFIPFFLVIALGVVSTIYLKGIQFTQIREMIKVTFKRNKSEEKDSTKLSSFEVFCISMGNRIGVGNIAGPITAILIGGPGAIFWMWIFATIGGASSFIETTVGQLFKNRDVNGHCYGGPAYNIAKGLNMKKFAVVVAFIMILMYFVGYISSEVNTISQSLCDVFQFENNNWIIAIGMTILTAVIVIAGLKKIANASMYIVPIMAVLWIIICFASIILSGGFVNGLTSIFYNAFNVPSLVGGGVGSMLVIAMKRGIWSNEAGLGTISNVSSSADVKHPAQQGLSQAFGVLVDTIVSTVTALVVLSYGSYEQIIGLELDSIPTLQHAFEATLGPAAPLIIAFFIFLFAITCLMGDYVIGNNNLAFITRNKRARYFLIALILVVVFVSCVYASDELFAVMDILFVVVAIINVFVMAKLGKLALQAYKDYRKQKDEGIEEPEFHKSILSDSTGVTDWKD